MKLLRFLTQILIVFGPALYVVGMCLLIALCVGAVSYIMLVLARLGVPGVLAFLIAYFAVPFLAIPLAYPVIKLDERFHIKARVSDWYWKCTE